MWGFFPSFQARKAFICFYDAAILDFNSARFSQLPPSWGISRNTSGRRVKNGENLTGRLCVAFLPRDGPWKAIIFCWKKLSLDDQGWIFTSLAWRANLQLRKRKPQGDLPHVTWDRWLILYERPGAQPLLCSSTRDALEARYGTIWQLPCVKQQLWRLWMHNHSYMNFEVTGKVWWLHSTLLPIQGRCPR